MFATVSVGDPCFAIRKQNHNMNHAMLRIMCTSSALVPVLQVWKCLDLLSAIVKVTPIAEHCRGPLCHWLRSVMADWGVCENVKSCTKLRSMCSVWSCRDEGAFDGMMTQTEADRAHGGRQSLQCGRVEEQLHDSRRHTIARCANKHTQSSTHGLTGSHPTHTRTGKHHQRDQRLPSRPPTQECGEDDGDVVHVFQERPLLFAASNMVLHMPFLSHSELCVLESKRLWEANSKKC